MSTGDLPVTERLNRLKTIHLPVGPCERHRSAFWKGLKEEAENRHVAEEKLWAAIGELSQFKKQVVAVLVVMSVLGPAVAELFLRLFFK